MDVFVVSGNINDILAKLEKETQGCKGMKFADWIELRKHEKRVAMWIEMGVKNGI